MRPVSSRFLQSSSSFGRASPSPARARALARGGANEREREREREERSSRESSFLSPFVPSTLSLFLLLSLFPSSSGLLSYPSVRLPPFLLYPLSLPLSFTHSLTLTLSPSPPTLPHSFPLRGIIAYGSLLGLTHFPPLPLVGEVLLLRRFTFSVVLVFRASPFSFSSYPSPYSPAGGSFSTRVRARRSVSPSHRRAASASPFSLVLFCPCRSQCSLHSSNLNAGRAGVLYRLRK